MVQKVTTTICFQLNDKLNLLGDGVIIKQVVYLKSNENITFTRLELTDGHEKVPLNLRHSDRILFHL